MIQTFEQTPRQFRWWPDWAQEVYIMRVNAMLEGQNIPDDVETPEHIIRCATEEAEREIELMRKANL